MSLSKYEFSGKFFSRDYRNTVDGENFWEGIGCNRKRFKKSTGSVPRVQLSSSTKSSSKITLPAEPSGSLIILRRNT